MFVPLWVVVIAACVWYFVAKKHEERIDELEGALPDDEPSDEEMRLKP